MYEESTSSFHTSLKFFRETQYGFVDWVLWQLVPYQLQNFLELIDVLRLGLKWLVAFKHSSPDMVDQRVEVKGVRRPFIFTNEFTAVGSNSVLSQLAMCAVVPSCWKMKPDGKTDLQSWTSSVNRVSTQSLAFTLAVSRTKCNLPFPPKWTPAETMTCLVNFALSATSRRSSTFVWKLVVETLNIC